MMITKINTGISLYLEISNNNENLFILDLLDLYKNENHNDYFLECDGHWNYHEIKWPPMLLLI